MSTTTAPNPLLTLLDIVASPLLLFNAEAQVVFANQAAKAMACRPALLLAGDPKVRTLVQAIIQGKIVMDTGIRVEALSDNGIARLACTCAPKPIAGLVALAVSLIEVAAPQAAPTEAPAPAEQRLSLQQIMELLRTELLPPIQKVLDQTEPSATPKLAAGVRELQERLNRVVDLVNVFGEDALIGDERMLIGDMVRSLCDELAPLTRSNNVSFMIEGLHDDLPPVYGSRRLMRRALLECLHNAVVHARAGVHSREPVAVGVDFRASGQHLLLNIKNMGVLSAAKLSHHAAMIFRPSGDAVRPGADGGSALRIGLPLAQRVLQLHGGRLRVEQDSAGELNVLLELPTGAPQRNTQHLDMLQAQIYAEDLSKLMARSRTRSKA